LIHNERSDAKERKGLLGRARVFREGRLVQTIRVRGEEARVDPGRGGYVQ